MEGKNKKSTKPPPLLNIYIYNSKGHFVYFKDFEMKGVMPLKNAKMHNLVLFPKEIYISER